MEVTSPDTQPFGIMSVGKKKKNRTVPPAQPKNIIKIWNEWRREADCNIGNQQYSEYYSVLCKAKSGSACDWNTQFQTILDEDVYDATSIQLKVERLQILQQNFLNAAKPGATQIAREYHLQEQNRSIPSAGLADPIYRKDGIMYQVWPDMIQARQLIKSFDAVLSTAVKVVTVPLAGIIIYRGLPITATACIKATTNTTFHNEGVDSSSVQRLIECMRSDLSLVKDIPTCHALDGRFYILDARALVPFITPRLSGVDTLPRCCARKELLAIQMKLNNKIDTELLASIVITQIEIAANVWLSQEEHTNAGLINVLHNHGVNTCLLGVFRSRIHSKLLNNTNKTPFDICTIEVVARVCKAILRAEHRLIKATDSDVLLISASRLYGAVLEDTSMYWSLVLDYIARSKFPASDHIQLSSEGLNMQDLFRRICQLSTCVFKGGNVTDLKARGIPLLIGYSEVELQIINNDVESAVCRSSKIELHTFDEILRQASGLIALGQFEKAGWLLEESKALFIAYDHTSTALAELVMGEALLAQAQGLLPTCVDRYAEAENALIENGNVNSTDLLFKCRINHCTVAYSMYCDNPEKCREVILPLIQQAAEYVNSLDVDMSISRIKQLYELQFVILSTCATTSELVSLSQEMLKLYETLSGDSLPPEAALVLSRLGLLEQGRNNFNAAEEYFRSAVTLLSSTSGRNDPGTSQAMVNLASLYVTQGDEAKKDIAVELLSQALVINEELELPEQTVACGTMLAEILLKKNELNKAENAALSSVKVAMKCYGPNSEECIALKRFLISIRISRRLASASLVQRSVRAFLWRQRDLNYRNKRLQSKQNIEGCGQEECTCRSTILATQAQDRRTIRKQYNEEQLQLKGIDAAISSIESQEILLRATTIEEELDERMKMEYNKENVNVMSEEEINKMETTESDGRNAIESQRELELLIISETSFRLLTRLTEYNSTEQLHRNNIIEEHDLVFQLTQLNHCDKVRLLDEAANGVVSVVNSEQIDRNKSESNEIHTLESLCREIIIECYGITLSEQQQFHKTGLLIILEYQFRKTIENDNDNEFNSILSSQVIYEEGSHRSRIEIEELELFQVIDFDHIHQYETIEQIAISISASQLDETSTRRLLEYNNISVVESISRFLTQDVENSGWNLIYKSHRTEGLSVCEESQYEFCDSEIDDRTVIYNTHMIELESICRLTTELQQLIETVLNISLSNGELITSTEESVRCYILEQFESSNAAIQEADVEQHQRETLQKEQSNKSLNKTDIEQPLEKKDSIQDLQPDIEEKKSNQSLKADVEQANQETDSIENNIKFDQQRRESLENKETSLREDIENNIKTTLASEEQAMLAFSEQSQHSLQLNEIITTEAIIRLMNLNEEDETFQRTANQRDWSFESMSRLLKFETESINLLSAVRIQRLERGRAARKHTKSLKCSMSITAAATSIIMVARVMFQETKKQDDKRNERAAVKIQSLHRGNATRCFTNLLREETNDRNETYREQDGDYLQLIMSSTNNMDVIHQLSRDKNKAAVKIQSVQRGRTAKQLSIKRRVRVITASSVVSLLTCAVCIQKEAFKTRKKTKIISVVTAIAIVSLETYLTEIEYKCVIPMNPDQAATRIQSMQRGRIARSRLISPATKTQNKREQEQKDAAAIKIQSIQRSRMSKKKTEQLRAERDTERHHAALRIQGLQRQKISRQKTAQLRSEKAARDQAAIRIQSALRGRHARVGYSKKKEENKSSAALKIQKHVRGRQTRKVYTELQHQRRSDQQNAAVKIQSIQRQRQARRKTSNIRTTKAIKIIQKIGRSYLSKCRLQKENTSTIQAKITSVLVKTEAQTRKEVRTEALAAANRMGRKLALEKCGLTLVELQRNEFAHRAQQSSIELDQRDLIDQLYEVESGMVLAQCVRKANRHEAVLRVQWLRQEAQDFRGITLRSAKQFGLIKLTAKIKDAEQIHQTESTVYLEAQDRNNLIQEQLHTWGWVVASGTESPDVVFHHAVEVLLLEESKSRNGVASSQSRVMQSIRWRELDQFRKLIPNLDKHIRPTPPVPDRIYASGARARKQADMSMGAELALSASFPRMSKTTKGAVTRNRTSPVQRSGKVRKGYGSPSRSHYKNETKNSATDTATADHISEILALKRPEQFELTQPRIISSPQMTLTTRLPKQIRELDKYEQQAKQLQKILLKNQRSLAKSSAVVESDHSKPSRPVLSSQWAIPHNTTTKTKKREEGWDSKFGNGFGDPHPQHLFERLGDGKHRQQVMKRLGIYTNPGLPKGNITANTIRSKGATF